MSKQYKTFLVLVFGIFVGVSVSLTSSVLAEKKERNPLAFLSTSYVISQIFLLASKPIMLRMLMIKPCWNMLFVAC